MVRELSPTHAQASQASPYVPAKFETVIADNLVN
jgi:hypothetical protein